MRKLLKWLGIGTGSLAGVGILAFAGLYIASERAIAHTYDVTPAPLVIPTDSASITHGRHVARAIAKCLACHGKDYSGGKFVDDPMLGRIVASNITPAGVVANYTDADWVRVLRHGVKPDGRSVIVMPSYEFTHLSDEDLAAVIAYMKTLPAAVNDTLPTMRFGPMGRFLTATGAFPVLSATVIDHDAPRPVAPVPAPTAEYGKYVASIGCVGCHGPTMQGGKPPATGPDVTPLGRTAGWTADDFRLVLRAGKRPDGTVVSTEMPWGLTTEMTDTEIAAVWAYLQTVKAPATVAGK